MSVLALYLSYLAGNQIRQKFRLLFILRPAYLDAAFSSLSISVASTRSSVPAKRTWLGFSPSILIPRISIFDISNKYSRGVINNLGRHLELPWGFSWNLMPWFTGFDNDAIVRDWFQVLFCATSYCIGIGWWLVKSSQVLVKKPIWSNEMNSRCQLNLIGLQTNLDGYLQICFGFSSVLQSKSAEKVSYIFLLF